MSDLPEPITREETYLAAAAGEGGTLPEPLTREEMYLAKAAGQAVTTPDPITRKEMYLEAIAEGGGGGGGVTVEPLSVTENGTYTADAGKAYSPVTVEVPRFYGTYATGEINIISEVNSIEITHNLDADCLVCCLQRVNDDKSIITGDTRYRSIFVMSITPELYKKFGVLDTEQEYQYTPSGTHVAFDWEGAQDADSGIQLLLINYFPATDGQILTPSAITRRDRFAVAIDSNTVRVTSNYLLQTGRWVWHVFALGKKGETT